MNVKSPMAAVTRTAPTFLVVTVAPVLRVTVLQVITEHVKVNLEWQSACCNFGTISTGNIVALVGEGGGSGIHVYTNQYM